MPSVLCCSLVVRGFIEGFRLFKMTMGVLGVTLGVPSMDPYRETKSVKKRK